VERRRESKMTMPTWPLLGVLALLAALGVAPARAADDEPSPALRKCLDAAGGVTNAVVTCIGTEVKVQDKRLNAAYKGAFATITPEQQKQLQTVQRLWIQYRDANCRLIFDLAGGTVGHVDGTDCVLMMTTRRAKELEAIAAGQ
jgi:uncharacterized protein YecT (DUF1311 family)